MFFAGLSLAEFLALFTLAGGVTVALYLLSRSRRRHTVSTLRFWQTAQESVVQKRRRRIDQPWSLLLQLLALLLLILAIAQPRLGRPESEGRDHVLLLDTSAWMQASGTKGTLSEQARNTALAWVRSLPARDRVMLVKAGALPTPVTGFEKDRKAVEVAIRASAPSGGALSLDQAFALGVQAQRMQARRPGEIVYAGSSRINAASVGDLEVPPNLRVLPVDEPLQNVGLVRVALKRTPEDPERWAVTVTIRNYGAAARTVPVVAAMGGAIFGSRLAPAAARAEVTTQFELRTGAAGWLEIRLGTRDGLEDDNRVTLEVPAYRRAIVDLCTDDAGAFRPLLNADRRIEARYRPAADCRPGADADLAVFDRSAPVVPWPKPALWLEPPDGKSPVPLRRIDGETAVDRWNGDHAITGGLRAADFKLASAWAVSLGAGDEPLAWSERRVLAAANARARHVVFGFHPLRSSMRYELSTPLLFANVLEWAAPATFQQKEVMAGAPGSVQVKLARNAEEEPVQVTASNGVALPFTAQRRDLQFFNPSPAEVRVTQGSHEQVYSLTLPGLADSAWEIPGSVPRGVPAAGSLDAVPRDLWRWLAGLGLLLLAAEWWLFARHLPAGTRSRNLSLGLKGAAIAAGLIALFAPGLDVPESKLAVGVLVDTSESVPAADRESASQLASAIESASGRHEVYIYPFARSIRTPDAAEMASGLKLKQTAGEAGRTTDIEGAVREASAALPSGLVPRLVVISDGQETRGSAARAAHQARLLGIPIDTFVLPGRPQPRLRIISVRVPGIAFTGEKFPIDLAVESPRKASGRVELFAEGRSLGASEVELETGENSIRVNAAIAAPGAISVAGELRAEGLGAVRFEQAVQLRRPRLLYLSRDPAGSGLNLLGTLAAAQFDVVESGDQLSEELSSFQLVVLNNWDLESIPPARKTQLERFVQRGGGLLVIGGEKNIYVEKKNPELDPLDRTLPATVAPPRSPEGALVILIVDKSSSMEGRKMELARLSSIGVIENLKPADFVGVLIFDNSHQWAVPIRRAEDRTLIKRLIAGITPDGGTQIAPALAEAYKRALTAQGVFKHIVLLTDGISEEGDSIALAQEAERNKITISTVGLGQDVNRSYLERVATLAKGKAYFLTDPSGLEQILVKDVMEHTGSTTVERPIQPVVMKRAEILSGLRLEQAPPLKGYVRFKAKPGADLILSVDKEDPLLVRWQYGLGRAAVFTSDAKSRWADAWVQWNGYDRFWANLTRDLLPHAGEGEAMLAHDAANGELLVDYRSAPHVPVPPKPPAIFAIGPGDFRVPIRLEKVSEGHYHGRVPIGTRTGLFRVRPLEESRAFPEVGFYLPEPELAVYGNNGPLLRQISEFTGGRFQPKPGEIFRSTGRSVIQRLDLWPGLLALAILLNLAEVAWRRLRGSAAGPSRVRPNSVPQAA